MSSKTKTTNKSPQPLKKEESFLDKFLLYCAGVNRKILEENASPIEKNKYTVIGTTVLFTAILASLSGSYALFTVFESLKVAVPLGAFWGTFIFNIDRLFLISMKKQKTNVSPSQSYNNQTSRENLGEKEVKIPQSYNNQTSRENFGKKEVKIPPILLIAIPRLILATFLGFLISKPLEYRLLSAQINEGNRQQIKVKLNTRKTELTRENQNLQAQLEHIKGQCKTEKDAMNDELNGSGGSHRKGAGNIYLELKQQYDECQKQVNLELKKTQIPKLIQENEQQMKQINQDMAKIERKDPTFKIASPSIFEQAVILHELGEKEPLISFIDLLITGLFISIEIAPLLAKLLMPYGSYDAALYMIEESQKDYCEKKRKYNIHRNKKSFAHQKEIIDTFWQESGGLFKYFMSQQAIKIFEQVKNNESLSTERNNLAENLIAQMKSEFDKCIKSIKVSWNLEDNEDIDQTKPNQNSNKTKNESNPNQNSNETENESNPNQNSNETENESNPNPDQP